MEEREYTRIGNDCVFHCKKILTKFNDQYIVIKMDYISGWINSDVMYEELGFNNEESARKYFNED